MVSAGKTPSGTPGALDLSGVTIASFGRRFGALLIDWALATVVAAVIVDDLRANPWPQLGIFVLVHAFFVGLFGQTLGMALARIRCVSIVDGGAIGLPRAIVRALLLAVVIPAVINDADGRGLHDRAARSIMVLRP
ncbi:RDD family protein [Actinoplanes sp. TRM 88003]|uniref:RDD family protein n=1 Tax=Paractinoplanes aksuensis TaxID=2939490 RepID=A0ABT1DYN1_9ACTN|nr:RDD family protein [Actinoplanes aksuensis]MCO8276005.1 RDD family protein [Actinoplanes aksuensis]